MLNLPGALRHHELRSSFFPLVKRIGKTIPPSSQWLGEFSDRPRVCASGLWNNNHVEERHDPAFLDTLEKLVAAWRR